MADEKKLDKSTTKTAVKTDSKSEKKNGFQKFIGGVASIPQRIKKSVLSTWYELRKVTWSTRQELINYSLVVLVFIALFAVLVGLLDLGASAFIRLIIEA